MNIAATIAAEIGAQETQVSTALKLLAEGNTVPFIARYRKEVAVEDVLNSAVVSDPLHRLDCCVVSDGGGALVVVGVVIAALAVPAFVRYRVALNGAGAGLPHEQSEADKV